VPADLEPGADPERSEGARPREKYYYYYNSNKIIYRPKKMRK